MLKRSRSAHDASRRWSLHRLTFVVAGPDVVVPATPFPSASLSSPGPGMSLVISVVQTSVSITCPGFRQSLDRRCWHLSCGPRLQACVAAFSRSSATACSIEAFHPFGCDGSRMECPRTRPEWSNAWERPAKKIRRPRCGLTAIVHLRYGLLWAWLLGKGTASEQMHLIHLLATLPARSPLVTGRRLYRLRTAGGDDDRQGALPDPDKSPRATLFTEDRPSLWASGAKGLVWYWPQWAQVEKTLPPLGARCCGSPAKKADVWLLTDVLNIERTFRMRQRRCFYRWRLEERVVCFAPTNGRSAVSSFGPALWPKCIACEAEAIAAGRADSDPAHATWELRHHGEPEEIWSSCGGSWC